MSEERGIALKPGAQNAIPQADVAPPSTLLECIAAIEGISSGRFVSSFKDDTRRYLACFYGGPFFALTKFAPELFRKPSINLVFGGYVGPIAEEGGRWLSLYSRIFRHSGKVTCTVCTTVKPKLGRAPRPILVQPPQPLIAKSWARHLRDSTIPPDALLLYPPGSFGEFTVFINELAKSSYGGKTLLPFQSRSEAIIFQRVLKASGFTVSDTLGFPMSADEPQSLTCGAWWLSVGSPPSDGTVVASGELMEAMRSAYHAYRTIVDSALNRAGASASATFYGTRSAVRVAGERLATAVLLSPDTGLDLATGRMFSRPKTEETQEEPVYVWDEKRLSAAILGLAPEHKPELSADENHFQLISWLGRAIPDSSGSIDAEGAVDEEPEPRLAEGAVESSGPVPDTIEVATPQSSGEAPAGQAVDGTSTVKLRALRSRLSRNAGAINVLAIAARLGRADSNPEIAFEAARSRIMAWVRNRGFLGASHTENCHVETPDGEVSIETDGKAVWALRFDDRKQMEAGAFWRVELTLLLARHQPAIGLRLYQVRRTEDAPAPVSGVPKVLVTIANEVGLVEAGNPLSSRAVRLEGRKGAETLLRMLLDPGRAQSVIAVSSTQDFSADASIDRVAERLVGAAHVVLVDDVISDTLIRHVGRERSVFGNAIRLYRPGFTAESDPFQHRVWTYSGSQLSPRVTNDIAEEVCAISLEVGDVEKRVPSFVSIRNHVADARLQWLREQTEKVASTAEEERSRQQEIRARLEADLAKYRERTEDLENENQGLLQELEAALRERTEALDENRRLRRKLDTLWEPEYEKDIQDGSASEHGWYPDTWDDLESWVELYGEGRLVLLPQAAKAARESPFRDIPLAYRALEFLVKHYVPLRTRSKDDNEVLGRYEQALAELGMELTPVGTAAGQRRYKKEYRRIYEAREVTLDMHLKRGAGFDPAVIFRLYFYYDKDQAKVVVGHLPTHLTNRTTHSG